MIENFENKINEYARILIKIGLRVEKGDTVVIEAPVECADFARKCVTNAYDAGAKVVAVHWKDDFVTREKYLRADDEVFDTVPSNFVHLRNDYALEGASFLFLTGSDPSLLAGGDHDRIRRNTKACYQALDPFYKKQMSNEITWCIAAVAGEKWAQKVFPEKSAAEAIDLLWEAIFETVRAKGDGDGCEKWIEHLDTLNKRALQLNKYNFKSLHYTNSLGTDLVVELPEGHIWASGESKKPSGQGFTANMPTEEIFTAPLKTGVNGIVYASKPLALNGNIVEDFYFVIKNGYIEEYHAAKGEEILKNELDMDAGSRFLGEVALVPYDSPISRQNILYFETLFDENASCHLAFGEAYPECLEGGLDMNEDELASHGLNTSKTHEDFMIGTRDLCITGTTHNGEEIPVFMDGNFVF